MLCWGIEVRKYVHKEHCTFDIVLDAIVASLIYGKDIKVSCSDKM